eukprot:ctg_1139.g391
MGRAHGKEETFARAADHFGYVPAHAVYDLVKAIAATQRDHGNREVRTNARMQDVHGGRRGGAGAVPATAAVEVFGLAWLARGRQRHLVFGTVRAKRPAEGRVQTGAAPGGEPVRLHVCDHAAAERAHRWSAHREEARARVAAAIARRGARCRASRPADAQRHGMPGAAAVPAGHHRGRAGDAGVRAAGASADEQSGHQRPRVVRAAHDRLSERVHAASGPDSSSVAVQGPGAGCGNGEDARTDFYVLAGGEGRGRVVRRLLSSRRKGRDREARRAVPFRSSVRAAMNRVVVNAGAVCSAAGSVRGALSALGIGRDLRALQEEGLASGQRYHRLS